MPGFLCILSLRKKCNSLCNSLGSLSSFERPPPSFKFRCEFSIEEIQDEDCCERKSFLNCVDVFLRIEFQGGKALPEGRLMTAEL
jgi:hypothetical protein